MIGPHGGIAAGNKHPVGIAVKCIMFYFRAGPELRVDASVILFKIIILNINFPIFQLDSLVAVIKNRFLKNIIAAILGENRAVIP